MKLHFEPNLDYQLQAIEAVCDLFRGQEICRTEFTVTKSAVGGAFMPGMESDLGIGNRLTLLDDELLKNLNDIQVSNGLAPSATLVSGDFTVEMETGTGKTYVYLRTIFELNKRFAFTKFVIVVPSIAVKEGVYKSLQITEDHFKGLYAGVPFDYFLYDSSKLGQVRNFATSAQIQIMVVTVGAINKKDVNNLYKDSEKTGGEKPIDLVKATRPIVVVDEPQSVDGGLAGRGKEALDAMNPLCTLRYSATHADKHHMVYRLDAVDAYERRLVKQIEVASATVEDAYNRAYVRLVSVSSKRRRISARVELDVAGRRWRAAPGSHGAGRRRPGADDGARNLCRLPDRRDPRGAGQRSHGTAGAGRRAVPATRAGLGQHRHAGRAARDDPPHDQGNIWIKRSACGPRASRCSHSSSLTRWPATGSTTAMAIRSRATTRASSRRSTEGWPGTQTTRRSSGKWTCRTPPTKSTTVTSRSTRRAAGPTPRRNNQANRDSAERAYNLIMKEKEKLLGFETPLKFIFSHSALREGWDNPNVFQICALRDIQTERERRQTVGRGLRLCVNQEGTAPSRL